MTMFLSTLAVVGGSALVTAALGVLADRFELDHRRPPPLDGSHEAITLSDCR